MIACGVARRISARRDLRYVHDRLDASLFRRLRELCGRLNQAGLDRIDEIGPIHALEGLADSVELEQVADDDLRPELAKVFGPLVRPMDEGADLPWEQPTS